MDETDDRQDDFERRWQAEMDRLEAMTPAQRDAEFLHILVERPVMRLAVYEIVRLLVKDASSDNSAPSAPAPAG